MICLQDEPGLTITVCNKVTVPVQNHWIPVEKTMNPWVFCIHKVSMKTDSKMSVLQFTEIEIDSLYCKAQQRLQEKVLFNNSHGTITAIEITQTGYSTKTSSDHSIDLCILWNIYHKLCCFFGDFFPSGTQDAEVTKSLHYHYHYHYQIIIVIVIIIIIIINIIFIIIKLRVPTSFDN